MVETTEAYINSISRLRNLLDNDGNVLLAFIFGSLAANRQRNDSDIDIAIFYKNPPSGFEILYEIDKLSKSAGTDIHLVILNNASPLLKHQVMKNKINLIVKDEILFRKFRENIMSQYEEYKYISGLGKYE
ncbi:MAG: nucleotidyltransferase domain-containing protein [Candidatus Acidulodesulfobacterium acidiphilum]|uniref:Nucleotidyltransferase domain-containing protein n=1 Tax=Candidatus Acidulodesulfobacterium acidiphilum TaxID=2597224 RepID=A0A520XH72_9DELT|nr:MAG: nucleotidyltransferase domain-containing protein [Candidatus Acidulodesulfobacterium acidiphilum]